MFIFNASSSSSSGAGMTEEEVKALIQAAIETEDEELRLFIETKLASVMRYKGQVATFSELPNNPEVGDFYNVEDTGKNFAWDGEAWDDVTKIFDLSNFYNKEYIDGAFLTVNEQIGAEVSDREKEDSRLTADIMSLKANLDILHAKLSRLIVTNPEEVVINPETTTLNDPEKDFIVSGDIENKTTITGKTVTLNGTASNSVATIINAGTDVTITDATLEGTVSKQTQGNGAYVIDADGFVMIKDCTFEPTSAYNCIEIGLGSALPKSVIIDNVEFAGKFSNNAISVYKTADNAVITISNCHFEDISNALRLSNTNNLRQTINIVNCTFDKWEQGQYAGMIICQDFTSKSSAQVEENNLFAPEKITINIQNCVGPNGRIETPADISTVCATGDENQLLYVYADKAGLVPYAAARFPKLTIN